MKTFLLAATALVVGSACGSVPTASPEVLRAPAGGATNVSTCAPARASFSIPSCCGGEARYFWNGTSCAADAAKCGCSCSGPDCDRFFASKAECEQAYATCK